MSASHGEVLDSWCESEDRESLPLDLLRVRILSKVTRRSWRDLFGNFVIVFDGRLYLCFPSTAGFDLCKRRLVEVGDAVGKAGSSGNSMLPHLHFQAMDDQNPEIAQPVLCGFSQMEVLSGDRRETLGSGIPPRWQRVRSV